MEDQPFVNLYQICAGRALLGFALVINPQDLPDGFLLFGGRDFE